MERNVGTASIDIHIPRPAAAALSEKDERQPLRLGKMEHPIELHVIEDALRTSKDGRIIGHYSCATARRPEGGFVDAPNAAHQTVRRGRLDEVVEGAPASLSGHGEPPILEEGALVHQSVHILACRALASLASLGDLVAELRVCNGAPRV